MNLKRFFSLTIIFFMTFGTHVLAQNWFKVQGTESKDAPTANLWGFIQPTYYYDQSDVPEESSFRKNEFNLRRARLGVRGVVPETKGKINYFLLTEFGHNGITQDPNGLEGNFVALTDASISINYIPALRLRFGQFKLPTGFDGLQAIQVHSYIEFSDVYGEMMMQRFGLNRSVGAYRDIGVQVFDWWSFGKDKSIEFAYAVMLSNGNGIDAQDNDANKDVSGKITLAKVFDKTSGPKRENLQIGAWFLTGKRTGYSFGLLDGSPVNALLVENDILRYGAEFIFNKSMGEKTGFHLIGETVFGDGWIYSPGFFNGIVNEDLRYFTQNSSVSGHGVPHSDLEAFGYYADFGCRFPFFNKSAELDFRYSFYNPDNGDVLSQKVSQTTMTFGFQYFFHPRVRSVINYELRENEWNPSVDNRIMAQLTLIFK